jgi:hypothetical protein
MAAQIPRIAHGELFGDQVGRVQSTYGSPDVNEFSPKKVGLPTSSRLHRAQMLRFPTERIGVW